MTKIIGLCGSARSGKDTFFNFAEKAKYPNGVKCRRVAFADELKQDLNPFLMEKFNISAWTNDDNEKLLIRPIMVAYGEAMREVSNGKYWIQKIKSKLLNNMSNGNISVITDVRYKNEIDFINTFPESKCLYIERIGVPPANEEERQNDEDLRQGASEHLKWRTFGEEEISRCEPIVESCLKRLKVIER